MNGFLARAYAFKLFDSFILIFPLYAVMFVDAGLTPVQVSIVLIAWSATAFVMEVPAGVVADRLPRKWVLAAAQTARAAGFTVWWIWPHFWGFLAGLVLWGLKSAFTNGTFEALVFDELKAEGREGEYVRVIGRARALAAVGVLLASLGAALIAGRGYGVALAGSLASIAVAMACAAALPSAARALSTRSAGYLAHLKAGLSEAARQPEVLRVIVFAALVLALGGALEEFWPIFGAKVGLTHSLIALMVGAQNALEALANTLAHRVSAWRRGAFYGLMIVAGALLVTAAGLFTPWSVALLVVYSGLMKLTDTVFEGRLQHAIASDNRATIGSVKGFAAQVGVSSLYVLFGPLAQATSYRIAFMAAGAATALVGATWLVAANAGVRRRAPA
ncbi:MAG TPA: MFS transporter [Caulobacteraceae bacterium]|nr:MFS transporter [Caulobacteraceae bacterium]